MENCKAFITGVAGLELDAAEKDFIARYRPWGFILFGRNIDSGEQVKKLIDDIRQAAGRADAPVLVDQEGGRVQRLRPPLAPDYPTAFALGDIYRRDRQAGLRASWLMSRLHAFDLRRLGFNVDCLPLLDVPVEGSHDVIGARAYGHEPHCVTEMGNAAAQGLLAGGVLPVMKHIPGHGRAMCDTHKALARVDASLENLQQSDFLPFKNLNHLPCAMTAHVVFEAIDKDQPATLSKRLVKDIIRDEIGFDGLLMTDDLSMKALNGSFADLTQQALAAGCDLVLHCNGDMTEMTAIAEHAPVLSGAALERAKRAEQAIPKPDNSNEEALRAEFHSFFPAI